jgi:hypothetical protein
MASKNTWECFVCKANGFPGTLVYLAGKDAQGRAIRLEDDGTTPHVHKSKVPSQQVQQEQVQRQQQQQAQQQQQLKQPEQVDLILQIKLLNTKMDKVISLLEERLPAAAGAVLKNDD